ncbi:hypothetical protein [Marinovum algicola]|uniref:hypothetical protein n=1 Tax=Marinovum algicola TaxID=42444 RepID=UPI003B52717D
MPDQTTQTIGPAPIDLTGADITMNTSLSLRHESPAATGAPSIYLLGGGAVAPTDWSGALAVHAGEHLLGETMERIWPGGGFTRLWAKAVRPVSMMFNHE